MLDPGISRLLATAFATPPAMLPVVAALRAAGNAPKPLGDAPRF